MSEWYKINNTAQVDSPALIIYPAIVQKNIELVKQIAGGVDKLRPHVKTSKIAEVCGMMLHAGITKFKCATIAEAEMLGIINAPDVLLAYQPVGPKISRLLSLVKAYPQTRFSCLVDSEDNASQIDSLCKRENINLDVYIDLNVGMNRTGIKPEKAPILAKKILYLYNLRLRGVHGYDGHIHDENVQKRQKNADGSFALVHKVFEEITPFFPHPLVMVMGGTPTFPMHIHHDNVECSPGTFVFWDWGYKHMLEDLPFDYAAVVISRVISVIDQNHICIDLGHKSVAAENPLPRVHFLNAPEAKPISQSEEHLVLKVPDSSKYQLGEIFYGVPVHICPTVALYDKAYIISGNKKTTYWNVIARNRSINY